MLPSWNGPVHPLWIARHTFTCILLRYECILASLVSRVLCVGTRLIISTKHASILNTWRHVSVNTRNVHKRVVESFLLPPGLEGKLVGVTCKCTMPKQKSGDIGFECFLWLVFQLFIYVEKKLHRKLYHKALLTSIPVSGLGFPRHWRGQEGTKKPSTLARNTTVH